MKVSRIFVVIMFGALLGVSFSAVTKNLEIHTNPITPSIQPQSDSIQALVLIHKSDSMKEIDYPESKILAKRALDLANTSDCISCKTKAFTHWGLINWFNGDYQESIEANKKAIELQKGIDEMGIANNENALGLIYFYMADYYSAIEWYQRALEKYILAQDTLHIQRVYAHLGLVYDKMADYPKSIDYLLKSSKLKSGMKEFRGEVYNISSLNKTEEKKYYVKEIEHQKKMLAIAEKNSDRLRLARAHQNIATDYYNLDQYKNAIHHYKTAIRIKESEGMIPYWNDLGKAYRMAGFLDSAIYAHSKALQTLLQKGTRISIASTYLKLGHSFYENRAYDNALTAYFKSLEYESAMGNRQAMAFIYIHLAKTFLEIGKYKEANDFANQGLDLAKEISAGATVRIALEELGRITVSTGDFEQAYDYQQQYQELSDRIASGKAQYELAKMGLQYDLDKKDIELTKMTTQNQVNNAKFEKERILRFAIIGALILLLMIGILVYTRYQQEKRTKEILSKQKGKISEQNTQLVKGNKEKELLLAEIHHRVKNNLQIVSSLLSIQALQLSDEKAINAVKEGQARVQAMGLIHENLYQHHDFNGINMHNYLQHLAESLISSFNYDLKRFSLVVDVDGIVLDIDSAIPLGLITNELVTNALKYAYGENKLPVLRIHLHEGEDGLYLEIKDNGNGSHKIEESTSFGLELVKELVSNLDGTTDFVQGEGLKVCIIVKKYKMTA